MTRDRPKNLAHSVRDRLHQLAKARGENFNFMLVRYALERLLYRLSKSAHGAEFVLKGAMLFTIWSKHPHRATKDLDLLGSGVPDLDRLSREFEFDGQELTLAVRATFDRRQTPVPVALPLALTEVFALDTTKGIQWSAFLSRSRVIDTALSLPEVVSAVGSFLAPVIETAAAGSAIVGTWKPGGPWV